MLSSNPYIYSRGELNLNPQKQLQLLWRFRRQLAVSLDELWSRIYRVVGSLYKWGAESLRLEVG